MSPRRAIRGALLALVVGFCGIEALTWARLGLGDGVRETQPIPAVFRDGTSGFYSMVYRGKDYVGVRVWSADGAYLGEGDTEDSADPIGGRFRSTRMSMSPPRGRRLGADKDVEQARFLRRGDLDAGGLVDPAVALNVNGAIFVRRQPVDSSEALIRDVRRGRPAFDYALWSFEAGRFVLRRAPEGAALVAIGPAGAAPTPDALPAGGFGRLSHLGSGVVTTGATGRRLARFVEMGADRIVEIEYGATDGSTGAATVDAAIRLVPLTPAPAGRKADRSSIHATYSSTRALAVDTDGLVWADVRASADERIVDARVAYDSPPFDRTAPMSFVTTSRVETGDPLVAAVRYRAGILGQAPQTWNLAWRTAGAGEHALVSLACVPAVLRPMPLAAASFLSGAPDDGESGSSWWWRDPVLAGQRRPIVLGANGLLAALCALIAWRVARVHCATARAAKAWTLVGFLLGPLGLLLLRLLAVRAPAETIGAGRRSLALETCPATDTPWPTPARTGREIFVEP